MVIHHHLSLLSRLSSSAVVGHTHHHPKCEDHPVHEEKVAGNSLNRTHQIAMDCGERERRLSGPSCPLLSCSRLRRMGLSFQQPWLIHNNPCVSDRTRSMKDEITCFFCAVAESKLCLEIFRNLASGRPCVWRHTNDCQADERHVSFLGATTIATDESKLLRKSTDTCTHTGTHTDTHGRTHTHTRRHAPPPCTTRASERPQTSSWNA